MNGDVHANLRLDLEVDALRVHAIRYVSDHRGDLEKSITEAFAKLPQLDGDAFQKMVDARVREVFEMELRRALETEAGRRARDLVDETLARVKKS